MWAIKRPDGALIVGTLSDTREDALWSLFDRMDADFQGRFWKKPELSRKECARLGYRAVRVKLVEVDK